MLTAEYVKQWLNENNLTQKEMAEKIGVSYTYLRGVLSGKEKFSQKLQVKIEKIISSDNEGLLLHIPDEYDARINAIAAKTGETPTEVAIRIIKTVLSIEDPTDAE